MAPSSKGLICFYLRDRGQCSNLQNCFFSHKFKGTGRVCKPFVDKGMCTNFNKCLYSHPKDRRGAGNWGTHWADDNPPSAKGLICFDLRDRGQCDFQNCWFSHDFKGTGTGCKQFVDKGMCKNLRHAWTLTQKIGEGQEMRGLTGQTREPGNNPILLCSWPQSYKSRLQWQVWRYQTNLLIRGRYSWKQTRYRNFNPGSLIINRTV